MLLPFQRTYDTKHPRLTLALKISQPWSTDSAQRSIRQIKTKSHQPPKVIKFEII